MTEQQLPPSWDGSVVLDIGGDVGALVLQVSADLDRREIDLHPDNAGQPNTHSAVRERRLAVGSSFAAVYQSLLAGTYTVVGSEQRITIVGGEVTEVALEAPAAADPDHAGYDHAGHDHAGHTHPGHEHAADGHVH
jgi:hypothetical protein